MMDKKISDVIINDIDISFIFNGICKDACLLRKKLMTDIECYTINEVIYQSIPTRFNPEKYALRFGLLIPKQIDNIGYINIKGPKMVKCEDIKGIDFVYNIPILYLDEGEELKCCLKMKKDCGKTHAKWNPVSNIRFQEHSKGFLFTFELTGLLTWDEIYMQL